MGKNWRYGGKTEGGKTEPKTPEVKKEEPKVVSPSLTESDVKSLITKYASGQPQNVHDGLYSFWSRAKDTTLDKGTDPSIVYLLCKAYFLSHRSNVVVVGNDSAMLISAVSGALQNERHMVTFDNVQAKTHVDKFEWNFRVTHNPLTDRNKMRSDFKKCVEGFGKPAEMFIVDSKYDIFPRIYPEAVLAGLIGMNTDVYVHNVDVKDHYVKNLRGKLELGLFATCSMVEGMMQVKLPDGFKLDKFSIDDLEKM